MKDMRGIEIEENDHVIIYGLPEFERKVYFCTVTGVKNNSVSVKRLGVSNGKAITIGSHNSDCLVVVDGLPND